MKPSLSVAVIVVVVAGACGGKPARIKHAAPPPVVVDAAPIALRAVVVDQEGKELGDVVTYSATPAGAITFTPDGRFACSKSADATMTLFAGGITAQIAVQCRMVKRIQVKPAVEVVLDGAAVPLEGELFDESGLAIAELPITYEVVDPRIAAVQDGAVSAVAPGETIVRAKFDPLVAETKVRVSAKAGAEALDIPEDGAHMKSLGQGRNVIDVVVDQPVSLSFSGDACPPQPAKRKHHVECKVGEHATLRIETAGAPARGKLTLRVAP